MQRTIYALIPLLLLLFTSCEKDQLTEPTSTDDVVDTRFSFQPAPEVIPLPTGFKPEGIVSGERGDFYVGSLANGAIFKGNYLTGEGSVWYTPSDMRVAVGLAYDRRSDYLFVAGGPLGTGYVYDTRSGRAVATFDFNGGFVNDVIVTRDAAYFTDSALPFMYKIPLSRTRTLPAQAETIPLTGDYEVIPNSFNANGITASPDGNTLIIVSTVLGALYQVDPSTGVTTEIDLGGDNVPSGDGLLRVGNTLYVVQNFLNQIAEIDLGPDYLSGTITDILTDSDFMIPTTADVFRNSIYAVNARFDVAPPFQPAPTIEFDVVRVDP